MRIGLALMHYDFSFPDGGPVSWERLAAAARRAEELGFDSAWISDHFFLSLERYGGSSEPQGTPEPLAALAALATQTERIRLGTLVLSAGFRHPATLMKSATTIDLLSGGRLDLGIGAGWYEEEYAAFGYDFEDAGGRFEVLEETVEALARLLPGGPVTWRGRRFELSDAYNHPAPEQRPRPPLWVGGKGGPRLLRLVARWADGWNTVWAWTPEAYADRVRALDEACEQEGRDPSTVRRSVGLYALVGEDEADLADRFETLRRWGPRLLEGRGLAEWGADKLVGTPERVVERLAEFAKLGVEEVVISASYLPFAAYDESLLDLIAETVVPAAASL